MLARVAEIGPAWRHLVRVVVRATPWVEACHDATLHQGDPAICRPIAADLWAVYMVLGPNELEPLRASQRDELGLDNGGLHVLAVRNLIDAIEHVEREGDDGAWMLSETGENEDDLLFVPAVWDWVSEGLEGDPVACLPSQDVLLVSGADDAAGLERLVRAAQDVFEQSAEPVSTTLLRRTEGRWAAFG